MCFAFMHDAQLSYFKNEGSTEPPTQVHLETSSQTSKSSSASSTPAKRSSPSDFEFSVNKKQKPLGQTFDPDARGNNVETKIDRMITDAEASFKNLIPSSETSSASSTPSKRRSPGDPDSLSNKKQKLFDQTFEVNATSTADRRSRNQSVNAEMADAEDDEGSSTLSSLRSTPAASIKSTYAQAPTPSGTKQAPPANDPRSQSTGLEKAQGPISAEDAQYLVDKVYGLEKEREELKSSANATRSRLEEQLKALKSDADDTMSLKEKVAGMVSQDQTEFLINQVRKLERTARDQKAQLDGGNSHTATQMKYRIYELETSERRMKEKMAREILAAKEDAQKVIQEAKDEAEAVRKERSERWNKLWSESKAKNDENNARRIKAVEAKWEANVESLTTKHAEKLKKVETKWADKVESLTTKHDEKVEALEAKYDDKIEDLDAKIHHLKKDHKAQTAEKDATYKATIDAIRSSAQKKMDEMKARHATQERNLKNKHTEQRETMRTNHHDKLEQMRDEYKEKVDAKAPKLKQKLEESEKKVKAYRERRAELDNTIEQQRRTINRHEDTIENTSEKLKGYQTLYEQRNMYESQVKTLKFEAWANSEKAEDAEDEMRDIRKHEGHLYAIMKEGSQSNQVRFNTMQRAKFDAQQSVVVKDRIIAGLRTERDAAVKLCKEQEIELKQLRVDLEKGTTMRPVLIRIRSPQEHAAYIALLTTEHEKTKRELADRDAQIVRLQEGLAAAIKDVEKSEEEVKQVNRELDLNAKATAVWSDYDPERTFSDAEVSPTESAFSIGYDGVEDVAAGSLQARREMEDQAALRKKDAEAMGAGLLSSSSSSPPSGEGSMVDANVPASAYARGVYHE